MRRNKSIMKPLVGFAILALLIYGVVSIFTGGRDNVEKLNKKYIKNSQYVVEIEIKQKHLSLSLDKHMKDMINSFEFEIPVSKDYFDSVSEGQVLADDFRMGSLLTSGSVGSWKVTIVDKIHQNVGNADDAPATEGKPLSLNISQTHVSFDIGKHIKDNLNDIVIDIKVEPEYYDALKKGNIIVRKFRWGSLFTDGSVGHWEVSVGRK